MALLAEVPNGRSNPYFRTLLKGLLSAIPQESISIEKTATISVGYTIFHNLV